MKRTPPVRNSTVATNFFLAVMATVLMARTAWAGGPRPLSLSDRDAIIGAHREVSPWDLSKPFNGGPVVVLAALFDGTRNDRDQVGRDSPPTVVAYIQDQLEKGQVLSRPAAYYAGVGTRGNRLYRLFDSAIGHSAGTIAQQACDRMLGDMHEIMDAQPDAEIRVFVAGFSRGAASARHFMNLLERGCTDRRRHGPPVPFRAYAILFDTVATGQRQHLDLRIPAAADHVIHYRSLDERRILFRPVLDDTLGGGIGGRRIQTIPLPGVHADSGSGYPQGVGKHYLALIDSVLFQMGLSHTNTAVVSLDRALEGGHDSRWWIEKLLGIGPARSIDDHERKRFLLKPAPLSRTRFLEWQSRENALFSERGAFVLETRQHTLPVFDVTWRDNSYVLTPVSSAYAADLANLDFQNPAIRGEAGARELQYSLSDGTMARFALPMNVLDRFNPPGPVRLEIGIVNREGQAQLWWMVDGVVITRARTSAP